MSFCAGYCDECHKAHGEIAAEARSHTSTVPDIPAMQEVEEERFGDFIRRVKEKDPYALAAVILKNFTVRWHEKYRDVYGNRVETAPASPSTATKPEHLYCEHGSTQSDGCRYRCRSFKPAGDNLDTHKEKP